VERVDHGSILLAATGLIELDGGGYGERMTNTIQKTKDAAAEAHPIERTKDVAKEASLGRSVRTGLIALNAVTLAIGAVVI
jgi:hypothetical protein